MRGLIFFFLIFGFLYSCQRKTSFSEEDIQWVEPYKVGQEVIFESTEGLRDTILILDKSIQYDDKVFSDKYQHKSAYISYYNRRFPKHMKYQNMFEMYKFEPDKPATFFFWFLLRGIDVDNYHNLHIEEVFYNGKYLDSYVLNTYKIRNEGFKFSPKAIYFNKSLGVIRYITHDSVEWNLIEVKQANQKDWSKEVWSRVGKIDYGGSRK